MGSIKDKVALITGAASGIGKATAELFTVEGANVILVDIDVERGEQLKRKLQGLNPQTLFIKADVSKDNEVRRMVRRAIEEFNRIDILFNNAGIGIFGSVVSLTEEEWDREIEVNLKSVFLVSKYVIPEMQRSGGGTIINTASGAGIVGTKFSVAYCASKGGIIALTKAMALDHAKDGIRVNAIAPGVVDTPFNDKILAESDDPERARKEMEDAHPMGRLCAPEEVATVALFLASEDSSFITGTVLSVDGGYTAQ